MRCLPFYLGSNQNGYLWTAPPAPGAEARGAKGRGCLRRHGGPSSPRTKLRPCGGSSPCLRCCRLPFYTRRQSYAALSFPSIVVADRSPTPLSPRLRHPPSKIPFFPPLWAPLSVPALASWVPRSPQTRRQGPSRRAGCTASEPGMVTLGYLIFWGAGVAFSFRIFY